MMMNTLQAFDFEESPVRTLLRDGAIWFVLADVCRALEIENARNVSPRLDEEEKGVHNVDTLGGSQKMVIVSESGLYALIFTSRKPVAKRFRKWVTGEVLPSIRKTGRYDGAQLQDGEIFPPRAEPRQFPDWPMDEMRTKRGVVDMYRLLYGGVAGQWIAPQLGFPVPPVEYVERGRHLAIVYPDGKGL